MLERKFGPRPEERLVCSQIDCTHPTPFGKLLRGPQEIRAKWAAAMDRSGHATCDFEILAVTGQVSFARWIASYTYPAERAGSATTAFLPSD